MAHLWLGLAGLAGAAAAATLPLNVTLNATYPGIEYHWADQWQCTVDDPRKCGTNSSGSGFQLKYWGTSLRVAGYAASGTVYTMNSNGHAQFGTSSVEYNGTPDPQFITYTPMDGRPAQQDLSFKIDSGSFAVSEFEYATQVETQAPDVASIVKQTQLATTQTQDGGYVSSFFNTSGKWTVSSQLGGQDYPYITGAENATLEVVVPANTSFVYLTGCILGQREAFRMQITPQPASYSMPDTIVTVGSTTEGPATLMAQVLDPHTNYKLSITAGGYTPGITPRPTQISIHGLEFYSSSGKKKTNIGAIVGGVVGGVVGIILIGGLLWWFCRRRRAKSETGEFEIDPGFEPQYQYTPYPPSTTAGPTDPAMSQVGGYTDSSRSGYANKILTANEHTDSGVSSPLLSSDPPTSAMSVSGSSSSAPYNDHKNAALAHLQANEGGRAAALPVPHEQDAGRVMRADTRRPDPLPPMYNPAWNDEDGEAGPGLQAK